MKLKQLYDHLRRDQNKENVEKPIVTHYAKYIGLSSSDKSYPLEEGAYVKFYEDRVVIDLLKTKHQTVVPYKNMTEIQNVDAGKKVDLDRVFGLSLVSLGVGTIVGLLWKRHAVITVIKYSDDTSEPQIMALDFMHNTKYAQPIMDRRMREARGLPSHDDTKSTMSIADELSKLAKLKEHGAITEEEFLQLKNNLMKNT
jgi:Short C-terminal domain